MQATSRNNINKCERMAKVNYVRYSITFVFFAIINVEVTTSDGYRNFDCKQIDLCSCKQVSGSVIDLSPLKNFTLPDHGFLTASNKEGLYLYHPCSNVPLPYKQAGECSKGCSLCLFLATTPSKTILETQDVLSGIVPGTFDCLAHAEEALFQSSQLVFKLPNVNTVINLECDESSSGHSVLYLEDPYSPINKSNNNLILRSPYSCFRSKPHDKHYMSGFAVFCLILIVLAAAYFFGGMLVLRHIKGATGTEMIPNYDFWVSVPSRIKNGFKRLKGRGSQEADSYERI